VHDLAAHLANLMTNCATGNERVRGALATLTPIQQQAVQPTYNDGPTPSQIGS